jgi:putative flippase GtrA
MLRRLLSDPAARRRFVRFLGVGGLSAAAQFSVLWLLVDRVRADVGFTVAYAVSVVTHYLLAKFWALPSERQDAARQLAEYLGVVVISYAINLGAFKLCHDGLGLSVMWATAAAVPPATVVVFLLLNFRVFRMRLSAGERRE